MTDQLTFAPLNFVAKKKRTKRAGALRHPVDACVRGAGLGRDAISDGRLRAECGLHGWRDDRQGARRKDDGQSHSRCRHGRLGDKGYASDANKHAAEGAGVS